MHKSRRKSAKVFHEKDATLISEMVCLLKQPVGGWWEEKLDLTPCKGATPKESSIREIPMYGSMRGQRSKDLLLLCGWDLYPLKIIKLYLEQSSSQHKKGMPRNFIGGSITCCKVDIRTTGKDISQLKSIRGKDESFSEVIRRLTSNKGRLMEIVDLYPELSEVLEYEESVTGLRKQIDEDLKA